MPTRKLQHLIGTFVWFVAQLRFVLNLADFVTSQILVKTIDLHYYVNTGLLLISLTLSFIVVCMHVGQVLLGGPRLR